MKYPRTGLSIGATDFGNFDKVGLSYTVMPYIEFNLLKKKSLNAIVGMGGSYFTKKFHLKTNPNNDAITTDLTWSFRLFIHKTVLQGKSVQFNFGAGYFHHSNGHTRLPNQGINCLLLSSTLQFDYNTDSFFSKDNQENATNFEKSRYNYLSIRTGIGQNVLSEVFNKHKEIYTLSVSYGRTYNNTFKLGLGLFYRFYTHYYDYINENEEIVK